ncbi:MAG: gluconate 2-dehydrogenase subunit 3 family protein [Myxococcales bacterium]|nr:gluconate 2-dehydrogenase subunit 3 family protein [Myxococcales bacterium]
MRADRRSFLGWFSLASVAIGGGVALVRGGNYTLPKDLQLQSLAPWQWAVFEAVGARILAPESAAVGLFADGYVAGLAERDRDDLMGLLAYVEHLAPIAAGFGPRFTQLAPAEQDRVLELLEASSIGLLRGGFQALKALCLMAHYRSDAAFAALGYGGPVVRWSGR